MSQSDGVFCLCHILPRRDGTSEQLQRLARRIAWWEVRTGRRVDDGALRDLAAGELPTPAGLRLVGGYRAVVPVLGRDMACRRAVAFVILGAELDRRSLVASLRAVLSPDLVDDVLIDGCSWDQGD